MDLTKISLAKMKSQKMAKGQLHFSRSTQTTWTKLDREMSLESLLTPRGPKYVLQIRLQDNTGHV